MTDQNRHLRLTEREGCLIITLTSPKLFQRLVLDEVERELLGVLEQAKPRGVVVDFSAVEICATSVITALLRLKKRLRQLKTPLIMAALQPAVHETFRLLNLIDTVFIVRHSVAESVIELAASAQDSSGVDEQSSDDD